MDFIIILPILFVAFVIYIPISIYKAVKQDEKDAIADEKAKLDWLNEENAKPKSAILFETEDDGHKISHELNAHAFYAYGKLVKLDSKSRAKDYLEQSYKDGYFKDNNNNTYPACKIKRAKVIVVNKDGKRGEN
jgi:hypothetical protein